MPYCPQCGSEIEAGDAFCGDCGARLDEQAPAPPRQQAPPARSAAGQGARPWSLLGGLVVVGALALGLAALYDAAANDGDWADSIFGGDGKEPAVVALTPTPQTTVQPSPTIEPTPTEEPSPGPTVTPPPEEPTATPASPAYITPEEAIAAFFEENDVAYAGDCEGASLDTDVGAYCTSIWEDAIDTRIYGAGPTFSEFDTWLLVARLSAGDDWTLVDFAPFVADDPVPPW